MLATSHLSRLIKRSLAALCLGAGLLGPHSAPGQTEVITNAADVLALSAPEAARGLPVRLLAVVISEADPRGRALVVEDETGGVYVLATNTVLSPYHQKDLLELTGVSDPGQFAPIVNVSKVRKLGTAPLPAPRPVSYHQLISGSLDAQWVEVTGVVQQYLPSSPGSQIRRIVLSEDGGLVHVRLTDPHDPNLKVDAEVKVHANCFYQFNQKRQILSPVLQVPPGNPITIVKPAPADPFAAPVRTADSLLLYSSERSLGHRVHVRGVVTYGQPGSFVWIRDETAGLRLQTLSPESVNPGDVIDVLGFPKFGSATPTLEDATYRKLASTNPPAPLILTHSTNAYNHEDDLVSLDAVLTTVEPVLEGLSLTLESEGTVFKGILKRPSNAQPRPDWQPGSRVHVAGICSVTYDNSKPMMGIWHPQSFQLLLRSPDDLALLEAPSWWTLQHVALLLGIASGALVLAIAIVTWLARNRLREQEQHRAMAEAEFAAILSERNRVAREIHDTLAQGLAATSVQLRLARKRAHVAGEDFIKHLDTAQQLVRGSLEEARNTIWNMRSQVLETGELSDALKNILNQMTEGAEVKTTFLVTGRARRLAPVIENNLLRVGQEAITNATKHARARQITVALNYGEKEFCLSVKDDGCGFNAQNPPVSDRGFGLVGMRERAAMVGGDLTVHAELGNGTNITLKVPLSGD